MHTPSVPAAWEAPTGRSLQLTSSKPAWTTRGLLIPIDQKESLHTGLQKGGRILSLCLSLAFLVASYNLANLSLMLPSAPSEKVPPASLPPD